MSPAEMGNKDAAAKNNEGVDHLVQTHYDVSVKLFREAMEAGGGNPKIAENAVLKKHLGM